MVQGDAYQMAITINIDGEPLDIDTVNTVEVVVSALRRTYPGEITYSDGKFFFPLSQEETFRMPKMVSSQVRVKFKGGDVIGSRIQICDAWASISKVVL